MTVHLSLSPTIEAKLKDLATTEGKDLASVVVEAIEEKLSISEDDPLPPRSAQRRITELRAWAASHAPLPYEADDSREGIYEGRGE